MLAIRKTCGLTIAVALLAVPASSEAVFIFDDYSQFQNSGIFIGADDWQGGDQMIVPDAGAGNFWNVDTFRGSYGGTVVGSYSSVIATLTLFRSVTETGTGPAFADPFGSVAREIGPLTITSVAVPVEITIDDIDIVLSAPPTDPSLGYGIRIAYSATGPGIIAPHYVNQQSTVAGSSSSQGWYRDLNDNGTLGADEYETFVEWEDGNLQFDLQATATPVPEPASLFGLTLAAVSLLAMRRKPGKNKS